MAKDALEKIKDLSREEILDKMRKQEIVPPTVKGEREEFTKFVSMTTDERNQYLSGITSESSSSGSSDDHSGESDTGTIPDANTDQNAGADGAWWKTLGYESEEKATEAHKTLIDLTTRQQQTIDSLNAKEGKRGQELKSVREKAEAAERELNQLKETAKPKIEKPQRPKRPSPKDYGEEGVFSEQYQADVAKYEDEFITYTEGLMTFERAELQKQLEQVKAVKQETSKEDLSNVNEWDTLWSKDIPAFQSSFNLTTVVPIKQISESYTVLNSATATADQKTTAQVFLRSIPAEDLKKYDKVRKAVELTYDFSDGYPKSKFLSIEKALFNFDMLGDGKEFNVVKQSALTPEEEKKIREEKLKKENGTVTPIPADRIAGADGKLSDAQTTDEKKKRLFDLNQKYNAAMNGGTASKEQFEKSPDFQEYIRLRQEVFGRVPPSLKR